VLKEAQNLIVIGCFCIGTNQVDLHYAADHGIAVFNTPLATHEVLQNWFCGDYSLARQLGDRSNEMHSGTWNKVSSKCWEVRGKTLGTDFTILFRNSPYPADRDYWLWAYRLSAIGISGGNGNVGYLL
jgi:lactate dehydrogenase-like 2-hydroxyacid dehydrogenase